MRFTNLSLVLFLAGIAQSHFILNYPTSLGFDDDAEGDGPCGGVDITFSDDVDSVQIGGFAVALKSTHAAANFLFRATLSTSAPYNWTNLLPVVSETGLGDFCIPDLVAPSEFSGQQGLVQVVQDGDDGVLYQCAAVNFVSGMNSTVGSACTNATGLTATITDESSFSDATTSDDSSTTIASTSSATSSSTSAAATATSSTDTSTGSAAMITPIVQVVVAAVALMVIL